ncbi:hypothetical protein O181_125246 [Austropuccinia psidii MF-1]|uniref:Uncharacterized protein n=1 Tax=Austropuccinia psidii MF-1 TaxID=1389203 RepID=A0A9Q3Q4V4_9BASI|nr:hypothetical protein [Austropuccinia psidii MF-1]
MTTRRGSKTPSNQMEPNSEVELIPQKVQERARSTQGNAISQRQVIEMPMISEPELELSMSNSNSDKSHSEGSNRHLHEPVQAVLPRVQGQGLGNAAMNPLRNDELLAHPQNVPQSGGNSEILQWMESTIIQTSNQNDQRTPCQKERGKQGRSPSSFYQKASSQSNSPRREEEQEKEMEEIIILKIQDPKNSKRCHGQCLHMGRTLMEFKDKEGQVIR